MINWLLCKIIGHKWITGKVEIVANEFVQFPAVCKRCLCVTGQFHGRKIAFSKKR